MLVAVLTARSSSRVPLNLEVTVVERNRLDVEGIDDSNRHRRGVNPTALLSGWDSLNAMAAWLVVEL